MTGDGDVRDRIHEGADLRAAGPPRRGGRPRSVQADEAILRATIEEWAEHSFAGLTIERIAARAGVARTTVYRRWAGLEQLCLDALDHVREPAPVPPPGGTVAGDLLMLLQDLRRMLTESRIGRLMPQLALEAGRRPDLSLTYWNDYIARRSSVVAQVLQRGMRQGVVRPDLDLDLAVDLLTGPLFKRCMWQLPTTDDDLRLTVEVVLSGLAPAQGPG